MDEFKTHWEGLIVGLLVAVAQSILNAATTNGTVTLTWQAALIAAAVGVTDWQTSHYWKHQPAPEPLPESVLPPRDNPGQGQGGK